MPITKKKKNSPCRIKATVNPSDIIKMLQKLITVPQWQMSEIIPPKKGVHSYWTIVL